MTVRESSVSLVLDGAFVCGGTIVTNPAVQVLTAWHCFRLREKGGDLMPLDRYVVLGPSGVQRSVVKIVRADQARDLILVELDKPLPGRTATIDMNVGPGDELVVVGSLAGEPFYITRGWLSKILLDGRNEGPGVVTGSAPQQTMLLDVRVWYGSSGGGVFDLDGDLVGVLVRGVFETEDFQSIFAEAVGPEALTKFLGIAPASRP